MIIQYDTQLEKLVFNEVHTSIDNIFIWLADELMLESGDIQPYQVQILDNIKAELRILAMSWAKQNGATKTE